MVISDFSAIPIVGVSGNVSPECTFQRECADNQFRCTSDNRCVSAHWRCDTENDCIDGSDEQGCDAEQKVRLSAAIRVYVCRFVLMRLSTSLINLGIFLNFFFLGGGHLFIQRFGGLLSCI